MAAKTPPTETETPQRFLPRRVEMAVFAKLLPLRGVEASSHRVVQVWGEEAIGKSTFLSSFRENHAEDRIKALWLQPTRDAAVDTIEEFIRACSKSVRYPFDPSKEEKVARALEAAERGKVNPVVSDDSILIMRSTVASNRKPYINQAAAASVGRTEVEREDIQISVGLGESKGNNQAEGFLDALPLQALGTDLIILYLERLDRLSTAVQDWLREYVVPAATRGAYRRSLVIVTESRDPPKFEYPTFSLGEWDKQTTDFRLLPLSEDDVYQFAIHSGVEPNLAHYLYFKSLGYPQPLQGYTEDCRAGRYSAAAPTAAARKALAELTNSDTLKLAALCLPDTLYPDELDVLFGPANGKRAFEWLAQAPDSPAQKNGDARSAVLPDAFRATVLEATRNDPTFRELLLKWTPMAQLERNLPSKNVRSKMLLLSGLLWLDASLCKALFSEQADRIMAFVTENEKRFYRQGDRFCITDRFREPLRQVASQMGHIGVGAILRKAADLWNHRRDEIEARIKSLETNLEQLQATAVATARKQSENAAQIRILERGKPSLAAYSDSIAKTANERSKGPLVVLLAALAIICFAAASSIAAPYSYFALATGLAASIAGLFLLPGWLDHRKAVAITGQAEVRNSPEFLRKASLEFTQELHTVEDQIDRVKRNIDEQKQLLRLPYIPSDAHSE